MNPNQALWEKGDFTKVAAAMRDSGASLVREIGVGPGMKVLDLGCGDGTTAVPAAMAGADVLGVDIARNLVEAGNRRAREAGLTNLKFQQGDATALTDLEDRTFDLVLSIFGAMFAPKPFEVAKEMVRVTKKGGRIVMGNWIPGDPTLVAQLLKISSTYSPPPPPDFISPMKWGVEEDVIERFGAAGIPPERIKFERVFFTFAYPGSPAEYAEIMRTYYGPTMNAVEAAEKSGKLTELTREIDELYTSHNQSGNPGTTSIPAAYRRVTVQV